MPEITFPTNNIPFPEQFSITGNTTEQTAIHEEGHPDAEGPAEGVLDAQGVPPDVPAEEIPLEEEIEEELIIEDFTIDGICGVY